MFSSSLNLEEDTIPQIQKWWDAIGSKIFQYLSTYKISWNRAFTAIDRTNLFILSIRIIEQKKYYKSWKLYQANRKQASEKG